MDPLEELEALANKGESVNFIPCLTWVRRGVAKADPDKVKLTQEELAAIIEKTDGELKDLEIEERGEDLGDDDDDDDDEEYEDLEVDEESAAEANGAVNGANGHSTEVKEEEMTEEDKEIGKKFDMDNYDDEDDTQGDGLSIGQLVAFADPKDDPYLLRPDQDDDASDVEDHKIKPTDNLIVVGHVEGDASILEVYVYNDEEDALYIHHDMLLPSFPMALEWIGVERSPEEGTVSNMVAVGTMSPVIDIWDLDLVNCLEPEFSLGKKAKKKKKIKGYGHKDAVLSLAWNRNAEHILASGSVDQTVHIWDLHTAKIATTLTPHTAMIQALQWHPFEASNLLTGCSDKVVRLFDCTNESNCKQWKVDGEVEKVLWNHFNPFTFLAATDKGVVQMFDARVDDKPLWTLNAHSDGINGMSLSSQCPDCLVTGSSDKTIKVWDIADNKPTCIQERNMKLGMIHCLAGCPDAPFVTVMGGDKSSDNLKVLDIRENSGVRSRFGSRKLTNPMGYSAFGYETANDAEPEGGAAANTADEEMADQFAEIKVKEEEGGEDSSSAKAAEQPSTSAADGGGGAAGKFRKKEKKKKNKKHVM